MAAQTVGVLALQGDFLEHAEAISSCGATARLVRNQSDLEGLDRLILPGGESTTMGIIAQKNGLIEPLKAFIKSGKPVWGTCAGLILLAKTVQGQKQGGQTFLGELDVTVQRNFFGGQQQSFETQLLMPAASASPIEAYFIRAPGIVKVGSKVKVLASYSYEGQDIPVAVRQANILATSFHTETTAQNKLHEFFLSMS